MHRIGAVPTDEQTYSMEQQADAIDGARGVHPLALWKQRVTLP
mgnify:CR=1 FL=1